MTSPYYLTSSYNKNDEKMLDRIESMAHAIHRYFKRLSKQDWDHFLETFYQTSISTIIEPFEVLQFKKNIQHLKKASYAMLIQKIRLKMTTRFLDERHHEETRCYHLDWMSPAIIDQIYDYIVKDFNQYIRDTVIYVCKWRQSFTRLQPLAFIIGDESKQNSYQEACINHDVLCLSKSQYLAQIDNHQQPLKNIYDQYIKRQSNHQRDIHIWQYQQNVIKHLQTGKVIPFLTYDALTKIQDKSQEQDLFILPTPEDLVELERWSYTYLNKTQYILWLKNDALLTHYKSVPKHVEVVIDLNVIYQEIFDMNPLESLCFHFFQHEVVPLLREIHQTLRIKKIKHYLYGYALSQNDILHRCLTLGFRHLIIHQLHLYTAIEESMKFIDYKHK